MDIYTAYSLCIHSEIPLLETMKSSGAADVTVRFGKLDDISRTSLDESKQVLGHIPSIGQFLVQAGQEIIIDSEPDVDISMLCSTILGSAMAVILRQRGLLVLHASAVVIKGYAISFMGGSGWGKSTLANAFHRHGYDILTDDVLAVNLQTKSPLVYPAFPQQRLWIEAANALGHQASALSPIHGNTPKLAYRLNRGFQQTPTPLGRVYVLAKGAHHAITQLDSQTAFAEIIRHTRAVSSLKSQTFVAGHLHQCTQLLKTTKVCRFSRKPSLEELPALVAMVEADLAEAQGDLAKGDIVDNVVDKETISAA
ncbi:MAG: hypothetical protein AAGF01_22400 [Cyanobacteria bacterium P01_G01_bin.38]